MKLGNKTDVPKTAVTQKGAILGMSGSGKTNCMVLLVEQMLSIHAQVVIFDPKGDLWGLRLKADGKTPGFPIPVFGGDHGDVPLKPEMGKEVANLVVKNDYSAILDVSEFEGQDFYKFAYEFASELWVLKKRNPGAMCLLLDEAEEFVPENLDDKGFQPKMMSAFKKIQKLGRSKGIGMWLAGQRPQEISKRVLNLSEAWFMFRTGGLQERDTIKKLIGAKDKEFIGTLDETLPRLETGHALIWSPWWLKIRDTREIFLRSTFDSTKTPEVGARKVEARKLSPIDIKNMTESMADAIEEAKQNDPDELKQQIVQLKRDVAAAEKKALDNRIDEESKRLAEWSQQLEAREKELQEIARQIQFPEKKFNDVKDLVEDTRRFANGFGNDWIGQLTAILDERIALLTSGIQALADAMPKDVSAQISSFAARSMAAAAGVSGSARTFERPSPKPVATPKTVAPISVDGSAPKLAEKQQKILDTLLTFEGLGRASVDRSVVAALAGMSPRGGGFNNYLGALRSGFKGEFPSLINYESGNCLSLTPEGRSLARVDPQISSVEDLHGAWKGIIKAAKQVAIIELVIARHPLPVSRDELAMHVDMSPEGGGFNNYLGGLRTLGVIDYTTLREERAVKATNLLFPEGLS